MSADRQSLIAGNEEESDNSAVDKENMKKSMQENESILARLQDLTKKIEVEGQTQDEFGAKNEQFMANIRKEGRGF